MPRRPPDEEPSPGRPRRVGRQGGGRGGADGPEPSGGRYRRPGPEPGTPRGGGQYRRTGGGGERGRPDGGRAAGDRRGGGRQEGGGGRQGAGRPEARDRSGGGPPRRPGRDEPRELPAGGRGWGGLARKGTRNLGERKWEGADHADRPEPSPPDAWEQERWVEERDAPAGPAPASRRRPPRPVPAHVIEELQKAASPRRAPRLAARLADGVRAFERDHFEEARQLLQPVADEAPGAVSVRQLLGLTYYRLGRWRQAVRELEAYVELSHSTSAHPVLADANRALGRHDRVRELWDEVRLASEDPATVTEGRIVAAGSLADQGRLEDAIALLEKGRLSAKHPEDHHLRLWYALADLYERVGEVPRARDLFERVARHDPELVDVVARRRALG